MGVNYTAKTILAMFLVFFICLCTLPVVSSESREENFELSAEIRYKQLKSELLQFKKNNLSLVRLFEGGNPHGRTALDRSERRKKTRYLELSRSLYFWEKAAGLKKDLINDFLVFNKNLVDHELESLDHEANRLSVELVRGIDSLKEEYKIGTFPIVHNFFIDLGLKKRGACKHWAEDLLEIISRIPRDNFTAWWGEAHPGGIREHNVAVLVPKGASFEDGILIDPWRTAGKPYWSIVKKDNHPWKPWAGYEPR